MNFTKNSWKKRIFLFSALKILVFPYKAGKRLIAYPYKAMNRIFKEACKKAGIEGVTLY